MDFCGKPVNLFIAGHHFPVIKAFVNVPVSKEPLLKSNFGHDPIQKTGQFRIVPVGLRDNLHHHSVGGIMRKDIIHTFMILFQPVNGMTVFLRTGQLLRPP